MCFDQNQNWHIKPRLEYFQRVLVMSRRCYKSRACNHDQNGGSQYSGSGFGGEIAKASVFDGLHFVYGGSGVGGPLEAKMVELSGLERVNGARFTLGPSARMLQN